MNILILIIGASALIPEFKTGTYNQLDYAVENHVMYYSSDPGRSDTRTVSFGYTFRDISQVVHNYDYLLGTPFGCYIEVISILMIYFVKFLLKLYKYHLNRHFQFQFYFQNLLLRPQNTQEKLGFAFQQIGMHLTINLLKSSNLSLNSRQWQLVKIQYIKLENRKLLNTGILIMNGFYYSKLPNNFYAEIIDDTETDFVVQLSDPSSCLNWVTYQAILGNSLNVWFQGLQRIVSQFSIDYTTFDTTLLFPDSWLQLKKFVMMGLNGFHASLNYNQRLQFKWRLNENSLDYRIGYCILIFIW